MVYEASVKASPDAAKIQYAINKAARAYEKVIANPLTATISVGWGSVEGTALDPKLQASYYRYTTSGDVGHAK